MAVSRLQAGKGRKLWDYWLHGAGAAKIGWGTPGDYNRAVALLSKYTPTGAHGLAAELHQAATGMSTAEHAKLLKGKAGGSAHSGGAARTAAVIRTHLGGS
jgi:hypothetical protein